MASMNIIIMKEGDLKLDIKIYAVGSNVILTTEIKEALLLILEDLLPIDMFCSENVKDHLDGSLYVCNQSQYKNLISYIPKEKIVVLNLTPTSHFYVKISSIPENSTVYVFNNKKPYAETLIQNCINMGITALNFVPFPYSELSQEETISILKRAEYIIGVDKLLGNEVLLSEKYKQYLNPNVVLIGAKRVAAINSACEVVSHVNTLAYQFSSIRLKKILRSLKTDYENQSLYRHYTSLDKALSRIEKEFSIHNIADKNLKNAIMRSALNQISPHRK